MSRVLISCRSHVAGNVHLIGLPLPRLERPIGTATCRNARYVFALVAPVQSVISRVLASVKAYKALLQAFWTLPLRNRGFSFGLRRNAGFWPRVRALVLLRPLTRCPSAAMLIMAIR
jgi:hypothetical protein